MTTNLDIENAASICRVTCGWKKAHLSLDMVRPYWRDVHSPAIARRKGIWEYRHYPLDTIGADLLPNLRNIDVLGKSDEQLMWLSDVRYRDEAALGAFGLSPPPDIRAAILGDIDMIVDKSTTYLVLGDNGLTLVDAGSDPAPQGPVSKPTFGLFLRQRGSEAAFRTGIRALAAEWARHDEVKRLRLSLFEVPDMEAERKAGYPIKTHPVEMQYQAWIDLTVSEPSSLAGLMDATGPSALADFISAAHIYSVPAVYTFNYNGQPTLSGLRGYMAVAALRGLGAEHAKNPDLLRWMYGDVVGAGPVI